MSVDVSERWRHAEACEKIQAGRDIDAIMITDPLAVRVVHEGVDSDDDVGSFEECRPAGIPEADPAAELVAGVRPGLQVTVKELIPKADQVRDA